MSDHAVDRRGFLKTVVAAVTTYLGVRWVRDASASSGPGGSSPHSWAMVIDQEACTGCDYCTLACRAHNDVPPWISWNTVVEAGEYGGETMYLARPCMHCDHPACVEVCMVGASYKRADGIVMMDYDKCIGCRYCEVACPVRARSFNWKAFTEPNPAVPEWGQPEVPRRPRGVVEKCSFCYQRIDRGLALGLTPGVDPEATPACVVACPVGARTFGDLNDPDSKVSQMLDSVPSYRLREDLGIEPRVYYLHVHDQEVEA